MELCGIRDLAAVRRGPVLFGLILFRIGYLEIIDRVEGINPSLRCGSTFYLLISLALYAADSAKASN